MSKVERAALVTGAGRGIGRAICERLAADGFAITGVARSEDELAQTGEQVRTAGGTFLAFVADVTQREQVEAAVAACRRAFGRIDLLCNNAGYVFAGPLDATPDGEFERMMAVNCTAPFQFCRAVWPVMVAQGGGTIINISSMAAYDPFPGLAVYGASKAWVNTMTTALAEEGAGAGIRVFGVAPGAVETRMLRSIVPDLPADQVLDPGEVADVVSLLADARGRQASGAIVTVRRRLQRNPG